MVTIEEQVIATGMYFVKDAGKIVRVAYNRQDAHFERSKYVRNQASERALEEIEDKKNGESK